MKQVDQFMAGKRKAEHRSVSDTCWLAVERANDAEHRATRRTLNPSAGSMIDQRGNNHSSEQCVIKDLGPFQLIGADGCQAPPVARTSVVQGKRASVSVDHGVR